MYQFASYLTDFADGGVVIPLCAAVALTLLLLRRTRLALVWTGVTAGVWGVMLGLKLAGYAIEHAAPHLSIVQLGLVTPSGHVAAAATAYGGLVGLLLSPPSAGVRRACLAALAIAGLIGLTRIALGDHTLAEVIVGGTVGTIGAGALTSWAQSRVAGRSRLALLGVIAIVMLMFHGAHVSWEPAIRATSVQAVRDLRAFP